MFFSFQQVCSIRQKERVRFFVSDKYLFYQTQVFQPAGNTHGAAAVADPAVVGDPAAFALSSHVGYCVLNTAAAVGNKRDNRFAGKVICGEEAADLRRDGSPPVGGA